MHCIISKSTVPFGTKIVKSKSSSDVTIMPMADALEEPVEEVLFQAEGSLTDPADPIMDSEDGDGGDSQGDGDDCDNDGGDVPNGGKEDQEQRQVEVNDVLLHHLLPPQQQQQQVDDDDHDSSSSSSVSSATSATSSDDDAIDAEFEEAFGKYGEEEEEVNGGAVVEAPGTTTSGSGRWGWVSGLLSTLRGWFTAMTSMWTVFG